MFYTKGKGSVTLSLYLTTRAGYERYAWCFCSLSQFKLTSPHPPTSPPPHPPYFIFIFLESAIYSLLQRNGGAGSGVPSADNVFLNLQDSGPGTEGWNTVQESPELQPTTD